MNLYVASSWSNLDYERVIRDLRAAGHEVWDWRNPPSGEPGFSWKEVDPTWERDVIVTTSTLRQFLQHHAAQRGYQNDLAGMMWADVCVLLLPSGRSAHMEAGYMCGRGKPVHVLREHSDGPDLMHLLFDDIHGSFDSLLRALENVTVTDDEPLGWQDERKDPE